VEVCNNGFNATKLTAFTVACVIFSAPETSPGNKYSGLIVIVSGEPFTWLE